jgi:UDP-glucose 4-epimerase
VSKAIVTGGAGFIGSHIADLLIETGMDVVVLDDLSTGDRRNVNSRARFVEGSVCDPAQVRAVCEGVEYFFHSAALPRIQPSFDDPVFHEEVNVIGTIRCLEALKGNPRLKKIVVSSSSACYGSPGQLPTSETAPIRCLSPYALQKYAAEQYALILGQRFRMPVLSLRYFNVYGPRSFNPKNPFNAYSSVIGIFQSQKLAGTPLTITGDGEQSRDFVHVRDVAKANLLAALSEASGEIYNVGRGSCITIRALASLFNHPTVHIPERAGEARVTWADITKIRSHLGWYPTIDLRTTLEAS